MSANLIWNQDGQPLSQRPARHILAHILPAAPKAGLFNSPFASGPANCRDIQSRNGQHYELIAEIWNDSLSEVPPWALIRFDDGLEILAWEEEVRWH